EPAKPRDASRMMVLDRNTNSLLDRSFKQLPELLQPGDVLVINDTRVIKARMFGTLERKGKRMRDVEVLFANPVSTNVWEVLSKPGKRIRAGDHIIFGEGAAIGTVGETRDHGLRLIEVKGADVAELLDKFGHIPLPPYISRPDRDSDSAEYQTMFAAQPGAVAAPTAGLHFTPAVLQELVKRGVELL